MGADKALLTIGGERLVDRATRRIAPVCGTVLVASGTRLLPNVRWRQIPDAVHDAGPIGGLLAGVLRAPSPLAAVVAVDMPAVSSPLLVRLRELLGTSDVAVAEIGGRLQPLHAVYRTRASTQIVRYVAGGGRSLTGLFERLDVVVASSNDVADAASTPFAVNVNEIADVADSRVTPR